jgi:hypothetical protein
MRSTHIATAPTSQGRGPAQHPRRLDQSALRAAFLQGLARRVDRDTSGTVTLPTGRADIGEVRKVLRALDRARQVEGRR